MRCQTWATVGLATGRRLLVGLVLGYAAVSLTLGGTRAAWPVFYATCAAWTATVVAMASRSARRSGPLRKPALAEVLATNLALSLALGEFGLRAWAGWAGTSPLVDDTLDAYRLRPGQDYGNGLRGNRLGYPGPDFTPDKGPGVCRIAALGDSFALGPAVPFADNYLTVLGQSLPHTEVYNFGVSGTGPREYAAILHRDVWAFRPDLVLVSVFVGNDITEVMATPRHLDPCKHALYLFLTRGWRLARERWRQGSSPAVAVTDAPASPLSDESFEQIEARRLLLCRVPPPAGLDKRWSRALADLDRIFEDCRIHGVPAAVVLIPDEFQVNPAVLATAAAEAGFGEGDLDLEGPQRRLVGHCAALGVPCLDLRSALSEGPATYAPRDTHWNRRGNRLAAAAITRWLRERPDLWRPGSFLRRGGSSS